MLTPPTGPTLFPLFHWMFYCNVNHFAICRLLHTKKNKKQQIYLFRIWGEPQKTKNTDTHKPKKTTMHLRTYPPLSQFQSMSLKTAYRFYFAKWVSQFFLGFFPPTQNRSPKLLIFLVWGWCGEPRIWICYVYGYTYDTRNYYCKQWSWFWEMPSAKWCKQVQTIY